MVVEYESDHHAVLTVDDAIAADSFFPYDNKVTAACGTYLIVSLLLLGFVSMCRFFTGMPPQVVVGDVDAALASSAAVVRGTMRVGGQVLFLM